MLHWILITAVALLWTGCVTSPDSEKISTYASRLNERNVQSCLSYQGNIGPYVSIRGITATGGVDLATCLEQKW
jgi:hypothetical protein